MANPYTLSPVATAEYFVASRGGRGEQAHNILQNLRRLNPKPNNYSIIGERRFGKTSLLKYLYREAAKVKEILAVEISMLSLSPQNPQGFYAMLTRRLKRAKALPKDAAELDYYSFTDFLSELAENGRQLLLFIDEFDLVAREQQFDWAFFDQLRYLANDAPEPMTLIVASVSPLIDISHKGIYGSPFFNIFVRQQLGPLSTAEATALIEHPPGGEIGFPDLTSDLIALTGRAPYLLQLACSIAWELRAKAGEPIDGKLLISEFMASTHEYFQAIWERSSNDEQQALCALANGTKTVETGFNSLRQRGYISDNGAPTLNGTGLIEFVRAGCQGEALAEALVDKPPGGRAMPPPLLEPVKVDPTCAPRRLALVIGVNRYAFQESGDYVLLPLHYAEDDAREVAQLLTGSGYEVTMLPGQQATYAAVEATFARFFQETANAVHPDSSFIFYFSGHGQIDPIQEDTAYLILYDTDPNQPAKHGLEMTKLVHTLLPQVRVPNSLVLLDSCHAGFAAGIKHLRPAPEKLNNILRQTWAGLIGRLVLAACLGKATAREDAKLGHGIFTYYLLKHWRDLDGLPPGGITTLSLIDYVTNGMRNQYPRLSPPTWSGAGAGPALILRIK